MKKFKGLLMFSDLDGTLFDENTQIPARNEKNIRYFIDEGGLFSVATGRSHYSLARYFEQLGINAPCVTQNGCCIFDYKAQEFVYDIFLNESAKEITYEKYREFPDLNVVLCVQSGLVVLRDPEKLDACFDARFVPLRIGRPESADEPWYKVVFVGALERLEVLNAELEKTDLDGSETVFSGKNMLELLPIGISKATGMLSIAKRLGIERESLCAIGDHFNDLEMIKNAGFGATMEDAPKELKNAASFIACNNNLGSVGHFIEWIDSKF